MPKKNPTPKSILNAPVSVPIVVAKSSGPNRHARRHLVARGGPKGVVELPRPTNVRRSARVPAVNVPHLGHHGNKAVRDA